LFWAPKIRKPVEIQRVFLFLAIYAF